MLEARAKGRDGWEILPAIDHRVVDDAREQWQRKVPRLDRIERVVVALIWGLRRL